MKRDCRPYWEKIWKRNMSQIGESRRSPCRFFSEASREVYGHSPGMSMPNICPNFIPGLKAAELHNYFGSICTGIGWVKLGGMGSEVRRNSDRVEKSWLPH